MQDEEVKDGGTQQEMGKSIAEEIYWKAYTHAQDERTKEGRAEITQDMCECYCIEGIRKILTSQSLVDGGSGAMVNYASYGKLEDGGEVDGSKISKIQFHGEPWLPVECICLADPDDRRQNITGFVCLQQLALC